MKLQFLFLSQLWFADVFYWGEKCKTKHQFSQMRLDHDLVFVWVSL